MQGSWILQRLDAETRALHAAADEKWHDLLRPDVTLSSYAAALERHYGFIAPYDAAIAYTPNLTLRPRARTTLLVRDLLSLGRSPLQVATMPMCLEIDLDCPHAALGWIYVVERSALSHAVLLRHLSRRLPITRCSAFLGVDAVPFGPAWADLDWALGKAKNLEAIVAGAREAFAVATSWFTDQAVDDDDEVSYG